MKSSQSHLKGERLVEDRTQCLAVHLGLELLLLVGQQVHLDIGIRGTAHIQGGKLLGLDHRHGQTVGVEIVFQLKEREIRKAATTGVFGFWTKKRQWKIVY